MTKYDGVPLPLMGDTEIQNLIFCEVVPTDRALWLQSLGVGHKVLRCLYSFNKEEFWEFEVEIRRVDEFYFYVYVGEKRDLEPFRRDTGKHMEGINFGWIEPFQERPQVEVEQPEIQQDSFLVDKS